jgi:hypothetical protein
VLNQIQSAVPLMPRVLPASLDALTAIAIEQPRLLSDQQFIEFVSAASCSVEYVKSALVVGLRTAMREFFRLGMLSYHSC